MGEENLAATVQPVASRYTDYAIPAHTPTSVLYIIFTVIIQKKYKIEQLLQLNSRELVASKT